jgi:hypothetical protein
MVRPTMKAQKPDDKRKNINHNIRTGNLSVLAMLGMPWVVEDVHHSIIIFRQL